MKKILHEQSTMITFKYTEMKSQKEMEKMTIDNLKKNCKIYNIENKIYKRKSLNSDHHNCVLDGHKP